MNMQQNRKLKVFLCHSKDDKPKVRELYRRLVADGFDAWLDEEKLMPGQDWDLEIRKAVRGADVVVVCLSNSSVSKAGYVQKEIRFALDLADEQPEGAIYLIPARLEDCQVPYRLNLWQWVNLFETLGYEKLKQTLMFQASNAGKLITPILHHISAAPNVIDPLMINIPAGNFLMGAKLEHAQQIIKSADWTHRDSWRLWLTYEYPQNTVELSEYFIGKYLITNLEYQVFVQDTKHKPPYGWDSDHLPVGKDNFPVVGISWNDAVAYCIWLSEKSGIQYRLPTEAEWEKAARGENGFIYPWGDEFDIRKANTIEAGIHNTSSVGQFSPRGDSPYGCADMSGNVREWV